MTTADHPVTTAATEAMSHAFRHYTGTMPGDNMWNLDMEKTWAVVAPATTPAVLHAAAERLRFWAKTLPLGTPGDDRYHAGFLRAVDGIAAMADHLESTARRITDEP